MKKSRLLVLSYLFIFLLYGCSEDNSVKPQTDTAQKDETQKVNFLPLPYEDSVKGRNSNIYEAAINKPESDSEKYAFINKIKILARDAQKKYGIPACVLGGMSVVESGYGFTRTGYLANNLFGLKYWNQEDPGGEKFGVSTIQLKGQPDEAWDASIVILKDWGPDRKVFKEEIRYDNRYLKFKDYAECVEYIAFKIFYNGSLRIYVENYKKNIEAGWSIEKASKQLCFEISAPRSPGKIKDQNGNDEYYQVTWTDNNGIKRNGGGGYCHLGGAYYKNIIGGAMDRYNLYEWNK